MNYRDNKIKYAIVFLTAFLIIVLLVIAATDKKNDSDKASISNGMDVAVLHEKDSSDKVQDKEGSVFGTVIDLDEKHKKIIIQDMQSLERVTYSYTGGTSVLNRYGDAITVSRLYVGEIVNIKFAENKKLSEVRVSEDVWEYQNVTGFSVQKDKKTITVGSEKYSFTDNTLVVSEGNITTIDKLEKIDVITLKGRDKQLDSIIVTKGHGYVRLDSTVYFEGGYLEIGPKIVELITENMVLPVPEGSYTMRVTKGDTVGEKEITVSQNEELRVNLVEFQSEAVRLGTLRFKIQPAEAVLYIDGVVKDAAKIIDVPYGSHKVAVKADGYEEYSQTIFVEDIYKEYDISLIKGDEEATSESQSQTETSENPTTASTKATTKVSTETTTYATIDYNKLVGELFD